MSDSAAAAWLKTQFGGHGQVYVGKNHISVSLTDVNCTIAYPQLRMIADHFGTDNIQLDHSAPTGCDTCGTDGDLELVIHDYTSGV